MSLHCILGISLCHLRQRGMESLNISNAWHQSPAAASEESHGVWAGVGWGGLPCLHHTHGGSTAPQALPSPGPGPRSPSPTPGPVHIHAPGGSIRRAVRALACTALTRPKCPRVRGTDACQPSPVPSELREPGLGASHPPFSASSARPGGRRCAALSDASSFCLLSVRGDRGVTYQFCAGSCNFVFVKISSLG